MSTISKVSEATSSYSKSLFHFEGPRVSISLPEVEEMYAKEPHLSTLYIGKKCVAVRLMGGGIYIDTTQVPPKRPRTWEVTTTSPFDDITKKKKEQEKREFIDGCMGDLHTIMTHFEECMDKDTIAALRQHQTFLQVYPETFTEKHHSAYAHIRRVLKEVLSTKYSPDTIAATMRMLLKMTSFGIRQETIQQYMRMRALKDKRRVRLYTSQSVNGSISVIREEDGQDAKASSRIVAKVRNKITSLRGSKKNELVAYEVDHLLGGDHVPATIQIPSGLLIQEYIPNAETVTDFLTKYADAVDRIGSIDQAVMHILLTLGILRGRGDGHGANTVFRTDERGALRPYDVDNEEDFVSLNYKGEGSSSNEGNQGPYMQLLGLPQGATAYARVLLILFSWEGIKEKMLHQVGARKLGEDSFVPDGVRKALTERLDKMMALFRVASQKKTPNLTPRELFFFIHGKEYVYQELKRRCYPDYTIFGGALLVHDGHVQAQQVYEPMCTDNFFFKNEKEMDTPFITDGKRSITSLEAEWYPGTHAVNKAVQNLKVAAPGKCIDVLEVDPEVFDQTGWEAYKKECLEGNKPVQSYMLAYFLKGLARRVARVLSINQAQCKLDIAGTPGDKLMLQITAPYSIAKL